jgi:hypothetical protein
MYADALSAIWRTRTTDRGPVRHNHRRQRLPLAPFRRRLPAAPGQLSSSEAASVLLLLVVC